MATAASKFTFVDTKVALKAYLGIDGVAEDDNLELWLTAAAVDCDNYCGWYYTDASDVLQDHTPDDPSVEPLIRMGVFEWVSAAHAMHASAASKGVAMAKTGALQEAYQGGVGGINAPMLARRVAYPLWTSAVHNLLRVAKAK